MSEKKKERRQWKREKEKGLGKIDKKVTKLVETKVAVKQYDTINNNISNRGPGLGGQESTDRSLSDHRTNNYEHW